MEPQLRIDGAPGPTTRFTLRSTDVSIANGLRRVILSEIPCVVLASEQPGGITIEKNTSRLNNELVKQRLSCVPVHVSDVDFPVQDYEIEIDVDNTGDSVLMVTTQQIKVRNRATSTYLDAKAVRDMFPPDSITDDFISLVRLRPAQAKGVTEGIRLTCRLSVGRASENAAYAVACTCAYSATMDAKAAGAAWADQVKRLREEGLDAAAIESKKQDWYLIDGKRYTVPGSFDLILETVGPFTCESLIVKAADVLIKKLERVQTMDRELVTVSAAEGTMPNAYVATLKGEGYTLGKLLEYGLFRTHGVGEAGSDGSLTYCGFRKPHPHIDESVIRVAWKEARTAEQTGAAISASAAGLIATIGNLAEPLRSS